MPPCLCECMQDAVGSPFENREIFRWDGFTHNRIGRGGPQADNPTDVKNKPGGRTQKREVSTGGHVYNYVNMVIFN